MRAALVLLALAGAVGGVTVLTLYEPGESSWYPRCQFHLATGLHCPGCGSTRALHALFNGRFAQALTYNALVFVIVPFLAVSLFRSLRSWDRREGIDTSAPPRSLPWPLILGGVVVAYGVLRNLPFHPFTLLAPHEL